MEGVAVSRSGSDMLSRGVSHRLCVAQCRRPLVASRNLLEHFELDPLALLLTRVAPAIGGRRRSPARFRELAPQPRRKGPVVIERCLQGTSDRFACMRDARPVNAAAARLRAEEAGERRRLEARVGRHRGREVLREAVEQFGHRGRSEANGVGQAARIATHACREWARAVGLEKLQARTEKG